MLQESLLTREGPLAQVWLAANLERKLNKQQFLQSNITQSAEAIVKATESNADTTEALTLRLSGQLLYGVVRIYSRKAKYLLDDVSDALLKLKSAFRSSSNAVTLPINATIIPSMNQIVLQDTVTQADLLYQEPLTFDDDPTMNNSMKPSAFFDTQNQNSLELDESIEMPRNKFDDDIDVLEHDDGLDIDLNFDLDQGEDNDVHQREDYPPEIDFDYGGGLDFDLDQGHDDTSIEHGRATDDANLSTLGNSSLGDLGNFDQPLETIDDLENERDETTTTQSQPRRKRKAREQPLGKKIITDKEIELNIRSFNDTTGIVIDDETQQPLDLSLKKSAVEALLNETFFNDTIAERFLTIATNKRQKTQPSSPLMLEPPELQSDKENGSADDQQQFFQDADIDFDFQQDDMLPDNQPLEEDLGDHLDQQPEEEQNVTGFNSGVTESTAKVENHLVELMKSEKETTFTDVLEKDALSYEPLSTTPKNEATRVFFELLVLSTNDRIKVKQQELFGEISIRMV